MPTQSAPPCVGNGQRLIAEIVGPLEGNLIGGSLVLCIETPLGEKLKIHTEITSCMPAKGMCAECSHFSKIRSFSTKDEITSIVLEGGGILSIQRQPAIAQ